MAWLSLTHCHRLLNEGIRALGVQQIKEKKSFLLQEIESITKKVLFASGNWKSHKQGTGREEKSTKAPTVSQTS